MDDDVISVSSDGSGDPRQPSRSSKPVENSDDESEETFRKRLRTVMRYDRLGDVIQNSVQYEKPQVPREPTPALPVSPQIWRRISRWYYNGAPAVLLQLLCLYMAFSPLAYSELDFLEYFAGCQSMTAAFQFFDYRAYGYEIRTDCILEDILHKHGFIVAATLLYSLHPCALVLLAPVCSSWIFVSRHKTGRSYVYPLGAEDAYDKVRASNVMVSRVVMQCLYCIARGIYFVIEQPMNSILSLHPRFQEMLRDHVIYQFDLDMVRLGAKTKKNTKFQHC